MTAANYDKCLAITLDFEGGYSNDAGDPGGPTKYGITIHDVCMYLKKNATAADVKSLTIAQAKVIYLEHYWKPVAGDAWPDGIDLCVFDAGVNSGVGRAKPWAQKALGSNENTFGGLASVATKLSRDGRIAAVKKYQAVRSSFLHGLRTWSIFGRGWGRRVAAIESLGVKMVLLAANLPAAIVKTELLKESNTAAADKAADNKKATAAVVAGGGAGGATVTQVDWFQAHWLAWVLAGVAVLLIAVLGIYFGRSAMLNRERADAYTTAAATTK